MPKILRIINRLNLGGPTYNVAYLSKYLSPEYETMLVTGMIDETEESSDFIMKQLGLSPVYIPEMHRDLDLIRDRAAYLKIKKIIKEFKPDIVHTHAAKAGTLGRLAAHSCGVPVIVHTFHGHVFHSYFSSSKTRLFIEIERFVARRTTCIVAISERQKKELGSIYKICRPEKIAVIPLGLDVEKFHENQDEKRNLFRKKYEVSDKEIVIAIVGRIVPVKNHQFFLKVLSIIRNQTKKPVRVFIVGDGESTGRIFSLAESMNLDPVFHLKEQRKAWLTFTSWIKNVDEVYAGADIICLTSQNEGTPVSLIEAQSAGKPVVSTRVGGVEDVVLQNESAFLTSRTSYKKFAEYVIRLIESDSLRAQMGKKGQQYALQKYSYQRMAGNMSSLYNELLNKEGMK
jgi:glycosyltransferase involved in cell wall biosynthesis